MPCNDYMVADVERQAPEGWTVEHLDDDSCPSQGWGTTPEGLRWYFRNRHGIWAFSVGVGDPGDRRYVAVRDAEWWEEGSGSMLLADEITAIVLECMARTDLGGPHRRPLDCAGVAQDAKPHG